MIFNNIFHGISEGKLNRLFKNIIDQYISDVISHDIFEDTSIGIPLSIYIP